MVTDDDLENDHRTKRVSFEKWTYDPHLIPKIDTHVSTGTKTSQQKSSSDEWSNI